MSNIASWFICNIKLLSIKLFVLTIKVSPAKMPCIKAVSNIHTLMLALRSHRQWPKIAAFRKHIGSQATGFAFTAMYFKHLSLNRLFAGLYHEAACELEQYISTDNYDMLARAVAEGRGAILLGAHYGPPVTAYALHRRGLHVRFIATDDWRSVIDVVLEQGLTFLQRNRWRLRTEILRPLVAHKDERELVRHVKNGGIALMLIDFPREEAGGNVADFLGQKMRFNQFPFKLAIRFNTPTFFHVMELDKQGYKLRFEPVSYSTPDIGLEKYVAFIQKNILECPFAWTSLPQFAGWFPSPAPLDATAGFSIENGDAKHSDAVARS